MIKFVTTPGFAAMTWMSADSLVVSDYRAVSSLMLIVAISR